MKCMSIRQPFTWAILKGIKKVENKSSNFPQYGGTILIHAGKKRENIGTAYVDGTLVPPVEDLPLGAIVGAAVMRDRWPVEFVEAFAKGDIKIRTTKKETSVQVRGPLAKIYGGGFVITKPTDMKECLKEMAEDPFTNGPYCILLSSPIEFEAPIPYTGQLGLFNVDETKLDLSPNDRSRLDKLLKQYPATAT